MTQTVEFKLRLYDGDPRGPRTWWDGDCFLSVIPLDRKDAADDAVLDLTAELRGREALFLLSGEDPTAPLPVLYMSAGEVGTTLHDLLTLVTAKGTLFDKLLLLGTPGASVLLPSLEHACRMANSWSLLNPEGRFDNPQMRTEAWSCYRQKWSRLLTLAGEICPGITDGATLLDSAVKTEKPRRLDDGKRSREFFCTGRGADGRARLESRGLRILAGSRSSPLDATPSLNSAFRETIKQLVDEDKLQKIDGVWTFVKDVRMASSVQAASILMRTAAGADAWKDTEGVSLTVALKKD